MDARTWMDKRVIFMCVSGSHAYGLNTPESDVDYRGVCIPPADYFYGLYKFDQLVENTPADKTIFNIMKFVNLAVANNPNIIELLYMPEDCVVLTSAMWDCLVGIRQLFLSKKVKHTYAGYAVSQIKRVETHRQWLLHPPTAPPTRAEYGLPEQEKVPKEVMGAIDSVIKHALQEELSTLMSNITTGIVEGTLESLQKVIQDDVSSSIKESLSEFCVPNIVSHLENNIPLLSSVGEKFFDKSIMHTYERERAYRNASMRWNSFVSWEKTRNPKRAELEKKYGYDSKHLSHTFRLLIQADGILRNNRLDVRLSPEHQAYCRGIKNGMFTYEEALKGAQALLENMEDLYKTSTLPHSADVNRINECLKEVLKGAFSSNGTNLDGSFIVKKNEGNIPL